MSAPSPNDPLPALPLAEWEPTKDTLHLWLQIVGKIRMASVAPKNHWRHVTLYPSVRGLTTRRLHANGTSFEIELDFLTHRLAIVTGRGATTSFDLVDGISVSEFYDKLHRSLAGLEIDVPIRETPFGVSTRTPFTADTEHASYDRDAVERFWRILDWTDTVFDEFAGWYCGKASPVHLFWHSMDLALARFRGTRAPIPADADPVNREAYSHELISFGFWAGDANVREPTYYSYTSPEPDGLRTQPLYPTEAAWGDTPTGSLALLPYDAVRTALNPRATLLAFLESAYEAGAAAAGWDRDDLESSWCPTRPELTEILRLREMRL